jgi:hypothetical protein
MANLTDDPTSYLKRDTDDIAIVLASSVASATFHVKQFGVAIQINMPGGKGIRVVTTQADALNAVAAYPADTPWTIIQDDTTWDMRCLHILTKRFGPPKTMDKALDVKTEGIAWRPDKMPVYGM